ncbi:phenylalanine--tRNA ligase subunit beta [Lachnospiraceae bacterium BX10]|jgi:phenylalanyl-tRNA synthetase beta chain|uniref:Phenylalanine--tRNA ligase beta subunit n=1 Tax=Enterocloster hominis (ex Liu et al. 2021) TaxID=2763663 RepID=A0ABR7NV10_9FIRM|nr:phenylalanine--tRNA ligase subunit beta [Enterocloster hominis]MBC8599958.1 phenylalanine--tRNA ligase subunit beta [Enterocloster hominis]
MNTSLSWIKAYVPDLDVTAQEYTDAMTLTGTKVEGFERLDKNLEKIVVGEILSIDRHPDADKLVICQVNVGDETLQIVTGAPNVHVGDKVPVVLDGGKVAGGHDGGPLPEDGITIKAGKLRGVDSYGMMCSIEELGSDRNMYPDAPESGLYILPADAVPGEDAVALLGLRDTVFEYEITSNRVDCYSVLGIAREAAATFGKEFKAPVITKTGNSEDINDYLKVTVENTDLCKRYCARMVKNIHLAPSPKWLQHRLAASGIRPINNIVDITNYIMEEYGQPMHAFDYDLLAGHEIVVKCAKDGDVFQTLDGQERKLDHTVLMINDAEKEVGIAGIMGGENSKITDDVKTMVFECATFDGTNIRLSAKKVGLRTDASGKYEKGLDPNTAEEAVNRACQLIEELGAGEVVGGMIDVYPVKAEESRVKFQPEKINALLGTDIAPETMLQYMEKIELRYDKETGEIVAPTWRQDIHCMADLAEEVARFYGYDKIGTTLPTGEATTGKLSYKLRVEQIARNVAEFCGFSEGMTYSFESPKVFDKLNIPAEDAARQTVVISNPLGEDFSVMRTLPLHGMLNSLSTNYNRRNKNVRLYELANVYLPKSLPLTELPDERMQFTLGMYGDGDFFTMKGVVEEFFDKAGMHGRVSYDPEAGKAFLHPGRQAAILYEGDMVGYLGEVHPDVLDNYKIGEKAYVAVLDMPAVTPHTSFDRKYTGIAKYPAVSRDLSMVVPKNILVGQIEEMIVQRGGKILESYNLFDIYEGSQILEGYKSVAYSITFRAKDHTLEEREINGAMNKILNGLKSMGIELRA